MTRLAMRFRVVERGLDKWITAVWCVQICPRAKPHIILKGALT